MKALNDWGLLALRLGTAGLMIPHGWSKMNRLVNGLTGEGVEFYNWLGIGDTPSLMLTVIGELVAPVLVLIGWKSRWCVALMAITMGVAAFMVDWDDPLNDGLVAWWPMSKNGGNVLQELVTGSNGTLQNMDSTSDFST